MNDLRLTPAFHIKSAKAEPSGVFTGFAATFGGPPDAYGDVINAGAFAKSLQEHRDGRSMPALLWSHDQTAPIGRWLEMEETARGLQVRGQLTLDVEKAREAHALMKDGALGLSIGYMIPKDGSQWDSARKLRVLKAVKLFEVSAVAIPANPEARITGVKSAISSIRDYESAVRDVLGYSTREAKRLASGGWPALGGRDVHEEAEIEQLALEISRKASELTSIFQK